MAKLSRKIGFIGAGNMTEAFIGAVTRAGIIPSTMIYASDVNSERLNMLKKTYGVSVMDDNFNVFSMCDIVVLAVKPQQMSDVLSQITSRNDYGIERRKIVISIAAGVPLGKLESFLYAPLEKEKSGNLPIIRVMPNTPALVLAGMSGMTPNRNAVPDDINTARTILEAMGKVIEFKEEALDAVTALSGSGPAYVFYLVESMIQGGIDMGLDPYDAAILTVTTLKGSVALIEEIGESPELLRRRVTSPGGTTEEAFKVLEKKRVKETIIEAMAAAARRSKELSR
ncbi:MAG: pyrroline-5-carboxylate reductase [Desulfobacteraceae bacterium A6]|nr:MAG: pyrroline-5-carboxylate reductase [Desulfobacteraceae bacterium A6]